MFKDKFDIKGAGEKNNQLWKRHKDNPILQPIPDSWAGDWIANETIIEVGNEYYMYLDGKKGAVETIGVAISPIANFDGVTWEYYENNPVLKNGPEGYDHVSVLDPSVIRFQGQLWMYYTALSGPPDRICLANSNDGLNWKKHENNPLFNGRCPHVILKNDVLFNFYLTYNIEGGYDVRLATSRDGITFERWGDTPILPRGAKGSWDSFSIVTTRIFIEDDTYNMVYAGDWERTDEPRGFGLATSTDLIHWEKFPGNPIFLPGPKNSWDSEAIWCPWVRKKNGMYYMWYCGSQTTYADGLTPQTGLATI